jgi:hypothetical protein
MRRRSGTEVGDVIGDESSVEPPWREARTGIGRTAADRTSRFGSSPPNPTCETEVWECPRPLSGWSGAVCG